jgi:hypothetical protein
MFQYEHTITNVSCQETNAATMNVARCQPMQNYGIDDMRSERYYRYDDNDGNGSFGILKGIVRSRSTHQQMDAQHWYQECHIDGLKLY